jgi:rhamnogalacturonyl hydrolase YesR
MKLIMLRLIITSIAILAGFTPAPAQRAQADAYRPKNMLNIMHRVADRQLHTWKTDGFRHQKADWTNAVCYTGLYSVGTLKGGKKYLKTLVDIGNDLSWNTGRYRFYADDYCIGQTYALLYSRYKEQEDRLPERRQV